MRQRIEEVLGTIDAERRALYGETWPGYRHWFKAWGTRQVDLRTQAAEVARLYGIDEPSPNTIRRVQADLQQAA